jgi:DNA-binding NtrC family response regulator
VVTLAVPPLRDRLADLAPLAEHFLAVHAGRAQKTLALGAPALTRLRAHHWPGNVRELEHAVQRAVVLARGLEIMPDDLGLDGSSDWSRPAISGPSGMRSAGASPLHREPATPTGPEALSELERERILAVLQRYQGNRRTAAQTLGIDRSTLWRKLRRHTTEPPRSECPSRGEGDVDPRAAASLARRLDSSGSPEAR